VILALVNVFIVGQDVMMFAAIDLDGHLYMTSNFGAQAMPAMGLLLVPQAWSLGVELMFYGIAPFLLRRSTMWILAIAILSTAIRVLLAARGFRHDPWLYRFFPSELAVFLAGALAYRAYRAGVALTTGGRARCLLGGYVALLLVYSLIPSVPEPVKRFGMVLLLAIALPTLFSLTKDSKLDNYIGRLSYPIYISHVLLLGVARYAGSFRAVALMLISVAVALVLVRFVEDPVDRWRARLKTAR
jgi:peptidoglycan/LPS O-acetylase OafA/YrhL